jgi:hypothetical protein
MGKELTEVIYSDVYEITQFAFVYISYTLITVKKCPALLQTHVSKIKETSKCI